MLLKLAVIQIRFFQRNIELDSQATWFTEDVAFSDKVLMGLRPRILVI